MDLVVNLHFFFSLFIVIKEDYSIQSSDEFVIMGNSGLLPCTIPPMVKDFVKVIHWQRSDGLIITGNHNLPSSGENNIDQYYRNFRLYSMVANSFNRRKKKSSSSCAHLMNITMRSNIEWIRYQVKKKEKVQE